MDFAGALCSKQQVCILTFWLIHVNGGGRELVRVGVRGGERVRVLRWSDLIGGVQSGGVRSELRVSKWVS